jgi:hypothetical protein
MLTRSGIWLAAILIAATPMVAPAANVVTLTFDSLDAGAHFQNLVESGFRISPSCHVDIFDPGQTGATDEIFNPYANGNVLGFDRSGCVGGLPGNPDYLGPAAHPDYSYVHIDYFGHPFSFLSFEYFGFSAFLEVTISSSKGGMFSIPSPFCTPGITCGQMALFEPEGGDWNGVKWILFQYVDPGAPVALFDNLRFHAASAPGTLALFAIGLAGLLLRRRQFGPEGRT